MNSKILLGYNQFLCAESIASGDRFSLSLFEDLNRLIESVVLYDEVVVLGDFPLPSGIFAEPLQASGVLRRLANSEVKTIMSDPTARTQFSASMEDVFGPKVQIIRDADPDDLIEQRISPEPQDIVSYTNLFDRTIAYSAENSYGRDRLRAWLVKSTIEKRNTPAHFYYLARAVLYCTVAERCGMTYAPDLLRLPIAALTFSRQSTPLVKKLYDALREKVHSEIEALTILGMPVSVFVPPLTSTLLSKSVAPKDYSTELLELREKFSGFRESYGEFLSVLQNPEFTLKEKIEAKTRMFSRITGIIDKGESSHSLNIKTVWDKLIKSSLDESGISADLSLSGIVSLLFDQLSTIKAKGHARALFDIWADTVNLKNYGNLVERSFQVTIDPNEVERYKRYSAAIQQLIRYTESTSRSMNFKR